MSPDNRRLLVFDLDGTLADTSPDIVDAVNASLKSIELPPLPDSLVISFVGEGSKKLLAKCFQHLGCSEETRFAEAVAFFYRYYCDNIYNKTRLYPGVEETLEKLSCPKVVLTNKPSEMAVKVLRAAGINRCFEEIVGGDDPARMKPDPYFLLQFMAKYRFLPQDTWMIGDSVIDIQTARNAGAKSIAVLYGFIPRDRLQEARPDYAIDSFTQLLGLHENHR